METTPGQDTANTMLLLDEGIHKRIGVAIGKILSPPNGESIQGEFPEFVFGMGDDYLQSMYMGHVLANCIADHLQRKLTFDRLDEMIRGICRQEIECAIQESEEG